MKTDESNDQLEASGVEGAANCYAAKSCQQIYFATHPQALVRLEVPKIALREKSSW